MTCCLPARTGAGDRAPARPASPDLPAGLPGLVAFSATKSFVGTDDPVIPQDGEGPRRTVKLAAFRIKSTATTNREFAAFVEATGYVTEAENSGWSAVFGGLLDETVAGTPADTLPWWARVDKAYWRTPEGPGSSIDRRMDHPVVHVSWHDARVYAHWCGGRLPTEAEWEHAARGDLADPRYPWGDDEPDDDNIYCNIWQGAFPHNDLARDGYAGTCPVDSFAPNGRGIYAMCGNVWEWTSDPFRVRSNAKSARQRNAEALREREKLLKGGSFLCHKSYCHRYRIAARSALPPASATSNAGFRVCFGG